jgi:hypothetical protein
MSLIFRDIVDKRGKNEGMDYPSLQGCNVLGTHRPRDASSKGRIVQGMHHPGMLHPGTHSSGSHRHGTQVMTYVVQCPILHV